MQMVQTLAPGNFQVTDRRLQHYPKSACHEEQPINVFKFNQLGTLSLKSFRDPSSSWTSTNSQCPPLQGQGTIKQFKPQRLFLLAPLHPQPTKVQKLGMLSAHWKRSWRQASSWACRGLEWIDSWIWQMKQHSPSFIGPFPLPERPRTNLRKAAALRSITCCLPEPWGALKHNSSHTG